jgi:hypothetical protein
VFLYVTSDLKDCFIESIKQITSSDLKYFSKVDVISPEIRNTCDDYSLTFGTLLELMGLGCFNKLDMKMIKDLTQHTSYEKYLSSYVSKEDSLGDIVRKILEEINQRSKEEDFRVAVVKESIPLKILALADIISGYFASSTEKKSLEKEIFGALYDLCTQNNSAKG